MKSTETPANGYFKGVSEWKNNDSTAPIRPPIRRKREQKTEIIKNNVNELESSPLFNSVQQRVQGYEMTKDKLSGRNAINGFNQSHHTGYVQVRYPLITHNFLIYNFEYLYLLKLSNISFLYKYDKYV